MSLKIERIRAGVSATDAAKHLFVSRMTLWRWEEGKDTPAPECLMRMAWLYGCTVEDLLQKDRRQPA